MLSRKLLGLSAVGLMALVGGSLVLTNSNTHLTEMLAGGMVSEGKVRTLTLDNTNKPTITDGVGTVTVGEIGIALPYCSASENGFVVIEGNDAGNSYNKFGTLIFFSESAGTWWAGRYGFSGSTINSVSVTFKNTEKKSGLKVSLEWCGVNSSNLVTQWNSGYTHTSDASGDAESFVINSDTNSDFLTYQSGAVGAGMECFGIRLSGNATWNGSANEYSPVEIMSIVVTFTCN